MFLSSGRRSTNLTATIAIALSVHCLLFNERVLADIDGGAGDTGAARPDDAVDEKFDESVVYSVAGADRAFHRTDRAELALNRLFPGYRRAVEHRDRRETSIFRNSARAAAGSSSSNCRLPEEDDGTGPNCAVAKEPAIKTISSSRLNGSTSLAVSGRSKRSAKKSRTEKPKRRSAKEETDERGDAEEEEDEEDIISRSVMEVGKSIMKVSKKMNKMTMSKPGMFMLGMAQANLHNFVMQSLMMSKMTLISMVMMFIREVVFGEKANQVKYYNFGYENPPHPEYSHHHSAAQRRVIHW